MMKNLVWSYVSFLLATLQYNSLCFENHDEILKMKIIQLKMSIMSQAISTIILFNIYYFEFGFKA